MGHNHTLKNCLLFMNWVRRRGRTKAGNTGQRLPAESWEGGGSQLGETPQIPNFNKHIKPMDRNKHPSS